MKGLLENEKKSKLFIILLFIISLGILYFVYNLDFFNIEKVCLMISENC